MVLGCPAAWLPAHPARRHGLRQWRRCCFVLRTASATLPPPLTASWLLPAPCTPASPSTHRPHPTPGPRPPPSPHCSFGVKSASKPRGAFDYVTAHLAGAGGADGSGGGAGPSGSSSPSPAPPHGSHYHHAHGSHHQHQHQLHQYGSAPHSGERHSGGSDRSGGGMPQGVRVSGSGSLGGGGGGGGYGGGFGGGQRSASAQLATNEDDERYSDDFEDDDEGDSATVAQQRNRIIKNVQGACGASEGGLVGGLVVYWAGGEGALPCHALSAWRGSQGSMLSAVCGLHPSCHSWHLYQ